MAALDLVRWASTILLPPGMVAAAFAAMLLLRRPRQRYLCPGPARSWKHWFPPGCGYELRALAATDGLITCPECGRRSTPRALRPDPVSPRPVVIAIILLAPGLLAYNAATHGVWRKPERAAPTTLLIASKRWLPVLPRKVGPEVLRRARGGGLRPWQARMLAPALVAELRQGTDYDTLVRARGLIGRYSAAAEPFLERALSSADLHQRLCAASLLRAHSRSSPSELLIRTTIESMGDAGAPAVVWVDRWTLQNEVEYLRRHITLAEPYLVEGLRSQYAGRRLYCALVLGLEARTDALDLAAPILAESLRSNNVSEDARVGVYGLAGFGDAAIPHLERLLESDDEQQRQAALLLLERLGGMNSDAALRRLISPGKGFNLATVGSGHLYW